jgi:hypothetical protein
MSAVYTTDKAHVSCGNAEEKQFIPKRSDLFTVDIKCQANQTPIRNFSSSKLLFFLTITPTTNLGHGSVRGLWL